MAVKKEASATPGPDGSGWYVAAMERLVDVAQRLSCARDMGAVTEIVRDAARALTGADGATLVLRDGDMCHYADENAVSPLWKGRRFPMKACISGWVMQHGVPAVIEDIYADPRIPADAYRPTFVKSLVMVPVRRENPVGAIGNYWARQRTPRAEEVAVLQALAHMTAVAMENAALYGQLQEKLAALEDSNRELKLFSWAAAHDLRAPLRAIDNLSGWIEEDAGAVLPEESARHLQTLRRRVARMEGLLSGLLEYAQVERKLRPNEGEMADGAVLLRDCLDLLGIPDSFRVRVDAGFSGAVLPRMPLQRVFCNLIDNAVKHHDRGGGAIDVGLRAEAGRYVFTVRDDGPGIPAAYHEKIFGMFQTLQPRDAREGSGMGLAFVKKMLQACGQDVAVESGPGRGTVFTFTWPRPPGAEES